jgi:hypothetical protein
MITNTNDQMLEDVITLNTTNHINQKTQEPNSCCCHRTHKLHMRETAAHKPFIYDKSYQQPVFFGRGQKRASFWLANNYCDFQGDGTLGLFYSTGHQLY